jgi:hypothetical protein
VVGIAGRTPSAPRSIRYYAAPRTCYQRHVEQGKGEEAASLTSTRPNRPGFERIFTLAIDAPQLGEGRGEDAAPARQRMSPAGHFTLGRSPAAAVAPLLLLHGRSGGRAHGLPLDDWRLRKKLTCGAHMSVSEEGTIRNMCVQIRSDNGTRRLEDVGNGKNQV